MEIVQKCEFCGQKISKRRHRVEKSMITALLKAVWYCTAINKKTFKKRDIKTLNPVEYTLITFLVKFWLLYKDATMKPGEFGIPFKRVKDFVEGNWSVAEFYEIDPLLTAGDNGYMIMSENRLYINKIPKHSELIKQFPKTIEYINNNSFTDWLW